VKDYFHLRNTNQQTKTIVDILEKASESGKK